MNIPGNRSYPARRSTAYPALAILQRLAQRSGQIHWHTLHFQHLNEVCGGAGYGFFGLARFAVWFPAAERPLTRDVATVLTAQLQRIR